MLNLRFYDFAFDFVGDHVQCHRYLIVDDPIFLFLLIVASLTIVLLFGWPG